MSKKIPNHLHRFKKVNLSRTKDKPYLVFRCMVPSCTYYIRADLAKGALCECNRCHNPMVMNNESIQLTTPHCSNCVKRKKSADVAAISEFLADNKT